MLETSDRYRRHTIPGSVALELRGSPTDENYFSGSTFVPDFLLVGKLISERSSTASKRFGEKYRGRSRLNRFIRNNMIPSFQIWNAASSCFPCIESMLSYRSTPPATNSTFLQSGTSFLIHPERNLEPSGTIWNHLDPNMESTREEPLLVKRKHPSSAAYSSSCRQPLPCPPIWNQHRNLERSGTIWNASRR